MKKATAVKIMIGASMILLGFKNIWEISEARNEWAFFGVLLLILFEIGGGSYNIYSAIKQNSDSTKQK